MCNLSGNNWDSNSKSNGNTLLFTCYNNNATYINPNPDILYNFNISSNFLNHGSFEFEIIYNMLKDKQKAKKIDFYNKIIKSMDNYIIGTIVNTYDIYDVEKGIKIGTVSNPNILDNSNNIIATYDADGNITDSNNLTANFFNYIGIVNLNFDYHSKSFELFNLSLVIYDIDEEELLSKDAPEIDFKRMVSFFPPKNKI